MVLAAGRGERMRPLTDHTPKPLLAVRGKPLMQWPMEALVRGGFTRLLVNTDWLGDKIEAHFGLQPSPMLRKTLSNQEQFQVHWSREGQDFGGALETLGGISRALPFLEEVFWVVAGDVFMPEFVFAPSAVDRLVASGRLGHLWLVPNPPFHPAGDFALNAAGRLSRAGARRWTYANLALLRPAMVEGIAAGTRAPLGPRLFEAAAAGRLGGSAWAGAWHNVGTPEQYEALAAAAEAS